MTIDFSYIQTIEDNLEKEGYPDEVKKMVDAFIIMQSPVILNLTKLDDDQDKLSGEIK